MDRLTLESTLLTQRAPRSLVAARAFALDNGVRVAGIGEAAERRQAISVLALQVRIGYLSNVPIAQRGDDLSITNIRKNICY